MASTSGDKSIPLYRYTVFNTCINMFFGVHVIHSHQCAFPVCHDLDSGCFRAMVGPTGFLRVKS